LKPDVERRKEEGRVKEKKVWERRFKGED